MDLLEAFLNINRFKSHKPPPITPKMDPINKNGRISLANTDGSVYPFTTYPGTITKRVLMPKTNPFINPFVLAILAYKNPQPTKIKIVTALSHEIVFSAPYILAIELAEIVQPQ